MAGTCTQVHALVLQTGNGSRRKKAQNRVIFSCRDCDLRGAHARNQRICHTFEVGLDVWLEMGPTVMHQGLLEREMYRVTHTGMFMQNGYL